MHAQMLQMPVEGLMNSSPLACDSQMKAVDAMQVMSDLLALAHGEASVDGPYSACKAESTHDVTFVIIITRLKLVSDDGTFASCISSCMLVVLAA